MKKLGKILLAVLLVVVVAVGALAIWQRKYVAILWKSLTTSTEKIAEEREENNQKLVEQINSYLDEEMRDFTEEEKARIEAGEDKSTIYAEILSERSGKKYVYDVEKNEMIEVAEDKTADTPKEKSPDIGKENSKTEEKGKESGKTENKAPDKASGDAKNEGQAQQSSQQSTKEPAPSADAIISKYAAQLYALQSAYTGRVESLVSQGAAYYNNLCKTTDRASARSQTISHFTSVVRSEEASCDAQVESIINQMGSELRAIGADTGILQTVRSTYNNEKQLKMSYYASRYLN